MLFLKRKKLIQIDKKVDQLLAIVEGQTITMQNMQQQIDVLEKRNESILDSIDETFQKVINSGMEEKQKIGKVLDMEMEELKRLQFFCEQNDEEIRELLRFIKERLQEHTGVGNDIDRKLDMVENEMRLLLINTVMDQIPEE